MEVQVPYGTLTCESQSSQRIRRQKHLVEVGNPKFEKDSITVCLCDCLLAYAAVSLFLARAVLMDKSVTRMLLLLSRAINLYILSIIINVSLNQTVKFLCHAELTFSKLCTFPWNIFTHRSLGANGRTSQTRTANSNKQNKTVIKQWPPENPAEISIMSMTDAISWVEKDQRGTMLLDKPFFFY